MENILTPEISLQPGQILARGVARHMANLGHASVLEFVPATGLRVDVMVLAARDELWIIECKSSRADFMSDAKWQNYLEWCDRFFWAVDRDFDLDLLPSDTGIILADGYDAEILRPAPLQKMAPARRKTQTRKIAQTAAHRLHRFMDPNFRI